MKNIKFRAWDKIEKQIFEVKQIDFFAIERNVYGYITTKSIFGKTDTELKWRSFANVKLMQYIGLKDCKGCEIYEGDIVASVCDGEILEVGDIQFDCGVFGIEWVRTKQKKTMVGSWGQKHNLRRLDDDTIDTNKIEVIGNVYQNSELLISNGERKLSKGAENEKKAF